jgi:hypothetical protein
VRAYKDAVPKNGRFAWDAAKGQLELFAKLGIKADLASEIIRTIDALMDRSEPDKKGLHTVVFVGHRVDEPGRNIPRFPGDRLIQARGLIRDKLAATVDVSTRVHVLASAAPGSDILCHEICRELGIDSTICVPMQDFARLVFGDLESWRARFLEMVSSRPVLLKSVKDIWAMVRGGENATGVHYPPFRY